MRFSHTLGAASLVASAVLLAASLSGCSSSGAPPIPDDCVPITDRNEACYSYVENVTTCTPAPTDYQPRQGHQDANGWPGCISDDNTWHLIGNGLPASASRSAAFEQMGTLLWNNTCVPTKANFLAARDAYSTPEGLASRIARRQDIHYPEVPSDDKFACQNAGVPELYPDRCAGPARLKPIIDDAFVQGGNQVKPRVQAARIEAALVWFFYLSMTSEVWTCSFDDISDCDSAAGYYTQVSARESPAGLAKYVAAQGPETHQRIYDALLAERCWRDADRSMPASDTTGTGGLYDLAQSQLNKAALRGEALILRQRIGLVGCETGDAQEAQIEFVKVLGSMIDHAAGLLDATRAADLKAYTDNPSSDAAAIAAAQADLDAIFACP